VPSLYSMILEHVSNSVKGSRHKIWLAAFFRCSQFLSCSVIKKKINKRTFYRLEKVGEITHVHIIMYFAVEACEMRT